MNDNDNELKHYGKIGMRWGTRRGQLVRNSTMFSKKRQEKVDKWELGKLKSKKGFRSTHQKKIDAQKIKILEARVKKIKKEKINKLKSEDTKRTSKRIANLAVMGLALHNLNKPVDISTKSSSPNYASDYAKWLATA